MKRVFESISLGGSEVSAEEDPTLRPHDWRELNHYLDAVWEAALNSNINLPEHGLLLGLEEDAYTYSWTPDCQAHFDALVSVTGPQGVFGAFPQGKNELIITLFVGKLVFFLTKGNCAKKGNFIGFPPFEREK